MSRKLAVAVVACLGAVSIFGLTPKAVGQTPPAARQPRPANNANLQVPKLSPQLEKLLNNWSQKSAKITKLRGTHHRFVYDQVWAIDKRATGAFYYEAPGKGRIDLKPAAIPKNAVSKKLDKTGKPYKVQADRAERWICDGTEIWQVNDATNQVDVFPIPKENQGQNIMDGPMPFLFGMPPDKAKRRYHLTLVKETPEKAYLLVKPRWGVDAANWSKADVILDKNLYLPTAVRLTDPAGNLETTYRFDDFHINKDDRNWLVKFLGGDPKNPFRPDLEKEGYRINHNLANQGPQVPSVANLNWKHAQTILEGMGCKVNIIRGEKAPNEKLTYFVYEQKPAAKTPLVKGQIVNLTVYDTALVKMAAAPARVPPVLGLTWKDAAAKLEQAGFKAKYLKGKKAQNDDTVYMVYQQSPTAGQPLAAGGQVTLTLYDEPQ